MLNVVVAGVGGQGTVLMARLIGTAAIEKGYAVRGSETIGMAQRGGSVVSHVKMGQEIFSPLVTPGQADLIIAFEPGEAVRAHPFLKGEGAMVVCDRAVQPVSAQLGGEAYEAGPMMDFLGQNVARLVAVRGEEMLALLPSAMCLNVALLGVAVGAGLLPFDEEDVERALRARVAPRTLQMNRAALRVGLNHAAQSAPSPKRSG